MPLAFISSVDGEEVQNRALSHLSGQRRGWHQLGDEGCGCG